MSGTNCHEQAQADVAAVVDPMRRLTSESSHARYRRTYEGAQDVGMRARSRGVTGVLYFGWDVLEGGWLENAF